MKKLPVCGILVLLLSALLLTAGCVNSSPVPPPASPITTTAAPAIPPSVAMTTDKTEYAQGEIVTLKITNGLDVPVWYIGYPQRDLAFWTIEKARNGKWQPLDVRLPLREGAREVCRIILYEQPVGAVAEIRPHADLGYEWDQKICADGPVTEPFEPEWIGKGRYRFAFRYSPDTVKSEDIRTKPWKRAVELGEQKTLYSNEFVLA